MMGIVRILDHQKWQWQWLWCLTLLLKLSKSWLVPPWETTAHILLIMFAFSALLTLPTHCQHNSALDYTLQCTSACGSALLNSQSTALYCTVHFIAVQCKVKARGRADGYELAGIDRRCPHTVRAPAPILYQSIQYFSFWKEVPPYYGIGYLTNHTRLSVSTYACTCM